MLTQAWRDLTFLHWAVDPAEVAPLLPPGIRPDVHEGRTYVGLVPFRMVGVTGLGPAGRACRTSAPSWRPTSASTRWTRPVAAVSSS